MVTMDEVIAEIKASGLTVISHEVSQAKYRNIYTNEVGDLIGCYTSSDGVSSYGPIFVFAYGERDWFGSDSFQHWGKVND